MGSGSSALMGWGWVAEMSGRAVGLAHPLEKSATIFRNASIHRLAPWQVRLRGFGSILRKERSSKCLS
jgi:hypothetical protein